MNGDEGKGIPLVGACYDCQQVTSGHCWRHSVVTYVIPSVVIVPQAIIVPSLPEPANTPEGRR